MTARYINPFTDFGFKKIFGEEVNKDLLIDFLNQLLAGRELVKDVTFKKNEQLQNSPIDQKAIFDIYCENEEGEKFIVEIQRAYQKYFKDRSIFYATFPIQEQAESGRWDFKLKAVYTICILDFELREDSGEEMLQHVQLMNTKSNTVFYDKLSFIYLEMAKFNKTLDELETKFDKWMYTLKNLSRLQERPIKLQERVFEKIFKLAEIAQYNPVEKDAYEESLKIYRDWTNVIDTAEEKGLKKGIEKGIIKGKLQEQLDTAKRLKGLGFDTKTIAEATQLPEEDIEGL